MTTPQHILDGAPEGATHSDDVKIYYKIDGVNVLMWVDVGWLWYTHVDLISEYEIKPLT